MTKKYVQKITTILLIVVITILSFATAFAAAEDNDSTASKDSEKPVYKGELNGSLEYLFNKDTGVLSIKGRGSLMKGFKRYKTPWYSYASKIKTVKLNRAVNLKNVAPYAFSDLTKLKSVVYGNKLRKFSSFSFLNSTSLKTLEVKSNIKSISDSAFKNSGLKQITFKSSKTSVYYSRDTLPKQAVIYADNPSKAYNYARKFKRNTHVFLRKIKYKDVYELLTKGEKYNCKTAFIPSNAYDKKLKWYTTNKKIASVNSKGVVTGRKKGICYVYAKSKADSKIKSPKRIKIVVTDYKLNKHILTNNNCYKECRAIVPKGIVVHSTGVNTPYVSTYLNSWNTPKPGGREVCVHGFLGRINGGVGFYQTLPFKMACWGVGNGKKGSYNYYPGYIQFECCEDDLSSKAYFYTVYHKATDLCAYLCLKYNFSTKTVVSHAGAHKLGYGTNHNDIDHWLTKYGLTMNDFRKEVNKKIHKIDKHPDLSSGYKNPSVKVLGDTVLRNKRCVDDYGNSVKIRAQLKKGDKVKFIRDRNCGWSYVKTESGKKGYVRNKYIDIKYKSHHYKTKVIKSSNAYSKPSSAAKLKVFSIKKGAKVVFVSRIKSGKKKGWALVKYRNREVYMRYSTLDDPDE